ncbi:zinc ABC transporter substrate-binding protein ZnuA [Edwardsiella anguillarum]|uniref:zinc ABC transporter substrate-binding protein ZnuA n=1 Tax=Edwardsiella TaxID=635 RepID=UPI00045D43F2|nr:zinc ABC transporter substrate-binding protein ZnuA [Edwardsiella anguillarum]AKM48068.1 zinc ABC transporter substrate-binding protein [Edwardsiella sp. EA181011]GAJ68345.1 high-affinity zinc uptake system protein ZnuA [Edwardsiella piscicida]RFT03886.1 zinc ABC transporter substrate-binding protein [Edwardsiella anguillarum]BET80671.1 zinc ABC transporter substrate-binding protein ZnuA [Edwardsiella anguillarum]BET83960.1 zinc ABC transporter substrate-binding protein ZnuA [Edwardsiella a
MIPQKNIIKRTLIASALSLCALAGSAQADVVTSVRPLGFIAAAIADGVMPTQVLLPDGASPHDYALRPSDIKRLRDADLVVWIGPEMESFLEKPTQQLESNKNLMLSTLPGVRSQLIAGDDDDDHDHHITQDEKHAKNSDSSGSHIVTNGASAGLARDHDHDHGQYNMHIWLSPAIAKQVAIAIHDRLVQRSPQNKDKLDVNLRKFEQQLEQTEKKVGIMLRPVQDKGYFVFHDAYGYFEKTFGLTPLGHFTVNPEIQPGARRLHQIRTQLVEQKAVCVFAEPQFRPAVISAIAQGTPVRQGTLDPLGSAIPLSADSYMVFLTTLAHQYSSCLKGD